MRTLFPSALTALSLSVSAFAQPFINLDFEQAIVQTIDPGSPVPNLEWGLAAPGWAHSEGHDTEYVFYNGSHIGQTQAYTLIDSNAPSNWPRPLEGEFSLLFRNGSYSTSSGGGWVNAFISQSGLIPADSLSVRLLATGIFSVFVNDLQIPMVSLGDNSYGGDISAFAGTVSELKILNAARPIPIEVSVPVLVDAIQFSPEPIPEPSAGVLFIGGAVFLAAASKARRQR